MELGVKGKWTGHVYGDNNHLEVGYKVDSRHYSIHCKICAKDVELHGDALHRLSSGDIKKGIVPCGCSPCARWSNEQKILLIRRAASDKQSLELLPNQYNLLKVQVKCLLHNEIFSSNYYKLKSDNGAKCKHCLMEEKKNRRKYSLDDYNKILYNIHPNYTVVGGSTKDLVFMCKICSNDSLVEEGFCTGLFTKTFVGLRKGELGCRCQKQYVYTFPQLVYKIEQSEFFDKERISFVRAFTRIEPHGDISSVAKWGEFYCKDHGIFQRGLNRMLLKQQGCPKCDLRYGGFDERKSAVFYVLKISSVVDSFIGFGISSNFKKRFSDHRTVLKNHGYFVDSAEIFRCSGRLARMIESNVKKNFNMGKVNIDGFKTESLVVHDYLPVKKFITEMLSEKYVDIVWENVYDSSISNF